MKTTLRKFDNWRDWVAAAEKGGNPQASSHDSGDNSWGGGSFAQVLKLAKEGWHDSREKTNAVLEPVRERLAEVMDVTWERNVDMVGTEPDIDRYMAGELECMFDDCPIIAPTKGKAMTVVVDAVVTGNIPAEEVFKRGAAVIALVEAMIVMGFELEVWVDMSVEGSGERWTALTRVHRAGDILDADQLVFAIGHPGMLRRMCFGVMEGEPVDVRRKFGFGPEGWGYGRPCGIHDTDEMVDASFTISWGNRQAQKMVANPVEWVLDQLETQGVYKRDADPWEGHR